MGIAHIIKSSDFFNNCFFAGLNAIRNRDRKRIKSQNTRNIIGSIDIDTCMKKYYPDSHRWDYLIGTGDKTGKEKAFFIEVNPVKASEVDCIIRKYEWLKEIIKQQIPLILSESYERTCHLCATSGVHIQKHTHYWRKLSKIPLQITEYIVLY